MRINGKRVVDATRPLHITVTPRDAALGKNKDPAGCAAARAIVRGYREEGARGARVHLGRTYVEFDDKFVRYRTPDALKLEIVSFDRGTKPEYSAGEYNLARIRHQIEGVRARGANK